LSLAGSGLRIEVGQEKLLLQYLRNCATDARFLVTSLTGWQAAGNLYVLPDETFGQQPDLQIRFNGSSEHRFRVAGNLQEWQEHVSKPCIGNSRLTFAVSCAFAGPLLPLVHSSGAGFHFRGTTSTGKSTALKVAGSVLGGGGRNHEQGFLRSWNTTLNGLESVAKLHNHGLLCLDEIGQADSKKVGAAAYMLANGLGRERMRADLERREAASWSLVLLSSGEKSLSDHAAEAGERIKGGQEVRLMDVPADAGVGFGLFEDIHGAQSSKVFAEALGEASCRFYGVAFRKWLTALVEQRATFAGRCLEITRVFEQHNIPQDAGPEVGRAARWFGLMAAAGELATEAGVMGWPAGEATRGAGTCFQAWLNGRAAGTGSSDEEEGIRAVRLFLELHGASRFADSEWRGDFPQRVINRAGTRRGNEFWISPEVFKQEVCKGFNAEAVAQTLARRGFLVRDGNHLARKPKTRAERREKTRYYVVLDSILESEGDAEPCLIPLQDELLGCEDGSSF
jgi:putative DNA primase/helicase